jgi:hypothetical protein
MKLQEIENSCRALAASRDALNEITDKIKREQLAIVEQHRDELRAAATRMGAEKSALTTLLQSARELFTKPKTLCLHGVVVGFEKERDKVSVPSEDLLISRIEKLLAAKASMLIQTTKHVLKDPFKRLPQAELQLLGVQRVAGADRAFVRMEGKTDVEAEASTYLGEEFAREKAA